MMFKILLCVVGGCLPHSCNMGNILNINSVKILVSPPPPRCRCSQAAAAAATTAPNWHRSASATAVAAADKLPQLPPCCRHCHRAAAAAKLLLLPPQPRRTGTAALSPLPLPPQTSYHNCHHAAATAAALLPPPNINIGLCVHQFLSTQIMNRSQVIVLTRSIHESLNCFVRFVLSSEGGIDKSTFTASCTHIFFVWH